MTLVWARKTLRAYPKAAWRARALLRLLLDTHYCCRVVLLRLRQDFPRRSRTTAIPLVAAALGISTMTLVRARKTLRAYPKAAWRARALLRLLLDAHYGCRVVLLRLRQDCRQNFPRRSRTR